MVTGCDSSNVAVWELESGNKAIVFSNAHGDEEITCMAFDDSYRRLLTGARNGTIKVLRVFRVFRASLTGIIVSVVVCVLSCQLFQKKDLTL